MDTFFLRANISGIEVSGRITVALFYSVSFLFPLIQAQFLPFYCFFLLINKNKKI